MPATALQLLRVSVVVCAAACSTSFAAAPDPTQFPFYDKATNSYKTDIVNYLAAKSPKAIAANPNGGSYWWTAVNATEASRRALENCELSQRSPCLLAAVDDVVQTVDPTIAPASAFANLGSELDPATVPFLSETERRKLAKAYAQERKQTFQYMALALHPRNAWFLKVDPSYKSQEEANEAALNACVNVTPPRASWRRNACLLYAEGSRVVVTLPHAVRYASASMVAAAERQSAPSAQSTSSRGVAENGQRVPAANEERTGPGAPHAAKRIIFVHTGGNDCPPCRAWRAAELPKLERSAAFKEVRFFYVSKAIEAPFPPPELFLPDDLRPLRAKLEHATGGRNGSPQQMLLVDGEVYDYWVGNPLDAAQILARIAAIESGTDYPGRRCLRSLPYPRGDLHCTQSVESK